MKVNKIKLQVWPIVLVLILNATMFFAQPIATLLQPVNSYHNKALIVVIITLLFTVGFLKGQYKSFNAIDKLVLEFFFIALFIFVIQLILKEDSLVNLLSNVYIYFAFLLYYPLKYLLNEKGLDYFITILTTIGTIYAFANLVIFLYVESGGMYSYKMPLIQYVNSGMRLPQSADIVGLTFLLLLYKWMKDANNKVKNLMLLILVGTILVFVSQVRMMMLAVTISSLIMLYIFAKKKYKKVRLLTITTTCFLCALLLLFTLYTGEFRIINSFLGEGQRYASAMYRLEEIRHYSQFMFINVFFGFGFTNQPHIVTYALTDIGIFAFVFRYGILGLLWLTHNIQIFVKYRKFVDDSILYYGLLSLYLITFISLSMFDPQRVVLFPVVFALIENVSRPLKKDSILVKEAR